MLNLNILLEFTPILMSFLDIIARIYTFYVIYFARTIINVIDRFRNSSKRLMTA